MPRRQKYYANAAHCYVTHSFPVLFLNTLCLLRQLRCNRGNLQCWPTFKLLWLSYVITSGKIPGQFFLVLRSFDSEKVHSDLLFMSVRFYSNQDYKYRTLCLCNPKYIHMKFIYEQDVGLFGKLRKVTVSFIISVSVCSSVHLSAWNTSAPAGLVVLKLGIG